jgi:hypothetical protein
MMGLPWEKVGATMLQVIAALALVLAFLGPALAAFAEDESVGGR